MLKKYCAVLFVSLMAAALAACGADKAATTANGSSTSPAVAQEAGGKPAANPANATAESRTIQYLGKDYTVPAVADRIVITGSVESMEDALVLGVKPVGAMTTGGKFAPMFAEITEGTVGIGEKTQPDIEAILKLKPDVILASTKFPAETIEKLNKVATTIPVSHISTDWEANLNLLAELAGKQDKAKQVLQTYKEQVQELKEKIGPIFKDKKVLAIRVRAGSTFIYPESVFFNPSLYADLGAEAPAEVKQAKAQHLISLEKLSEMNPDYLFVQFAESENKDTPRVFEELQNNPIWKSINAVKNGNLFVNIVDPVAQGGTAYSKVAFLKAVKDSGIQQTK
ncbi:MULTISPECIES: ABC transporter substrate-binding protein [Brevibacillus]|uniref:FeuA protein n=1 Tax=Brevibacillus borstelensis AK1 TaxID=1300222 RepID=M8DGH4_9BACL|nr:ABC transporter substrate-binding protein [Brevibacillus borstelensis]EMT52542.1 FeuA protein [Brevibacillus borstelensis AK1]KKX55162.1 iron-uptake system-binding protein [Brevibacillus borstelensis cifa_chp40]MCC0563884.1 ABC transporter substrate-binding protein [Brevibacillus borstelensis]MCM3471987.1 ABC transporter substrate-binding protein [Brevibacillus borstelensis]MCM3560170.1 ABC transporter substrate-binding protein [Brevibacillus borstelensis]